MRIKSLIGLALTALVTLVGIGAWSTASSAAPSVTARPATYGAVAPSPLQCSDPSVDVYADKRVAQIVRGQSSLTVVRMTFTLPNELLPVVVNTVNTNAQTMAYLANRGTLIEVCFFQPPSGAARR